MVYAVREPSHAPSSVIYRTDRLMRDPAAGPEDQPPIASDDGRPFVDPPWSAPLDVASALSSIPRDATISGMFFSFLVAGAKAQGVTLPSARPRYTQFMFYPVLELAQLVVEAAGALFPKRTLRHGFRILGRSSPNAFLTSMLGKVTLGATEGVHPAILALANGYQLNVRPSTVSVLSSGPKWAIVRVDGVPYFLDSHHVGVLEGVLHFANAEGTVRIASRSVGSADFLMTWDASR